jgi:7-cyano-7-deazaguanine synthase
MNRTLVILSGGLDSTVLAYKYFHEAQLDGCVSVNYGQRHRKELRSAQRTCELMSVPHYLLELADLRNVLSGSALTGSQPVPEGHYAEDSMKATVVPNRNMILIALAVGVAISTRSKFVAYGAHAGDHAIYPDCRPEFAAAVDSAVALCDYNPPQLVRPFINMTKASIVMLGKDLHVPFEQTWSCYKGGPYHCGRCGTCVERLEAFSLAGIEDPSQYIDRNYWKEACSQ